VERLGPGRNETIMAPGGYVSGWPKVIDECLNRIGRGEGPPATARDCARIGRYPYLPRPNNPRPITNHLYVWFERVYQKQDGEWKRLSHRTTKGPIREDDAAN
jgi:hypothetical protein